MPEYEENIRAKGSPHVGQTGCRQKYGTLWRIMEKTVNQAGPELESCL
jgi:hypothetical protein